MDLDLLKYPKLTDIKRALFVQPHPDDNEIAAGGTMAKLRKMGKTVFALTVTQGDGGSNLYPPADLVKIRHQEALAAAAILDITYLGDLGYNNSRPGTVEAICADIVNVIREHRIDTIFSVDPMLENEIHPVHIRTGTAVNEAFLRSGQAYYPFDGSKHEDAFQASILGHYFTRQENTIVDITDVYDLKMKAIGAHQSQINDEYIKQLAGYFSLQAYASGYDQVERIKLLAAVHTHAFTFPKVLSGKLK